MEEIRVDAPKGAGLLLRSFEQVRVEFKFAFAVLALGILVSFSFAELDLGAETIWTSQVSEPFLNPAPLGAGEFHLLLLSISICL
jgi:hypothetical protein